MSMTAMAIIVPGLSAEGGMDQLCLLYKVERGLQQAELIMGNDFDCSTDSHAGGCALHD
jgi:hypothetical protein